MAVLSHTHTHTHTHTLSLSLSLSLSYPTVQATKVVCEGNGLSRLPLILKILFESTEIGS